MAPKKRPKKKPAVRNCNKQRTLPQATIGDLPVEILTIIFTLVQSFSVDVLEKTPARRAYPGSVYRLPENRRAWAEGISDDDSESCGMLVPDGEIVSLSHPLRALEPVCRQWHDIAYNLRSRLVIFIDKEDPTPLAEIEAQIQKCPLDILFDVLVTRRNFDENPNKIEMKCENSAAKAAMKVLAPLMPRCQSFVFHVQYSTSLPHISQDFRGPAPNLRVLKLKCLADDADEYDFSSRPDTPELGAEDEFKFPLLTTLALNGNTFLDVCHSPSWEAQVKHLSIDTFSIRGLTAPSDFTIVNLAENIAKIGYIRHLTLSNIDIEAGNAHPGQADIAMDNLTVIGQSDIECMEQFNLAAFGRSLCFLHLVETPVTYESTSVVHHIRLERPPDILEITKGQFSAHRLDIIDCEELDDDHLQSIAKRCGPLRRLFIADCPNITVEGLKDLIRSRERLISGQASEKKHKEYMPVQEDSDFEEENKDSDLESLVECDRDAQDLISEGYCGHRNITYRSIRRLHITGHPGTLSNADREWFKRRVKFFHWN